MQCNECKKEIKLDSEICETCKSKNLLKTVHGKYYFQGQAFSKNKWYRKMGNYLQIGKDEVTLRRMPDEIRIEYIRTFVFKNIKKATFLMLILPCVLFLVLSLILLLGGRIYQNSANLLNENQLFFLKFLGVMFFIFGSLLLVKLIVLQHKVIMIGNDKRIRMTHITKKQYQGIINVFKKE